MDSQNQLFWILNFGLWIGGISDFLVLSGDLANRVATLLKKIRPHLNLLNHNRILHEQNMILQAATNSDLKQLIRELKNIIERSAYRDTTNEITPTDLGLLPERTPEIKGKTFYEKVEVFQKRLISDALAKAGGNQARTTGLSYHQFRYFLKKYGGPQTMGTTG